MTSPSYQSSFFDHGSNSQASQQFFSFFSLIEVLLSSHMQKDTKLSQQMFRSGQNAPRTSEFPGSSGVQTLFASPTWQPAVPSARTLVGVGQQRRMEGQLFQLSSI